MTSNLEALTLRSAMLLKCAKLALNLTLRNFSLSEKDVGRFFYSELLLIDACFSSAALLLTSTLCSLYINTCKLLQENSAIKLLHDEKS
jgi:hypothetical protein